MPICQYCGLEFHYLLFKCKWCDMLYCMKHRLPENHKCIFKPSRKNRKWLISTKKDPLYQEGSDQISKMLTPEEIYIGTKNNVISRADAVEYLITTIEYSNDMEIIVESLEIIDKLALKNKRVFKILENLLVSDENVNVKRTAIKTLGNNFPKNCINVIEWSINHAKSVSVKKSLIDALETVNNPYINKLKKKLSNKNNYK